VAYDAVLVLSFGGPEGEDDVLPFLKNVTRGRNVPRERLEAVGAHYRRFGGVSPINAANRALVAALHSEVDLPVYWGNRNWHPLLTDTVGRMAEDGVGRAVCFVTSAYGGFSSCRQYLDDIARAREAAGDRAPEIEKLQPFFDHPGFIGPFVEATVAALDGLPAGTPLAFTAHSVPLTQPGVELYTAQVGAAARRVAEQVPGDHPWAVAWQSRSGPPTQPWLEPDIGDHLAALAATAAPAVVVVPIGFVADHMEVVYDLDTQAASRAEELGLTMVRAATPGVHPSFVRMIRDLIEEGATGCPGGPCCLS
jgi:protoporphyrin/coproporphyrin ferrochelatase